jgi:hypothetical protein
MPWVLKDEINNRPGVNSGDWREQDDSYDQTMRRRRSGRRNESPSDYNYQSSPWMYVEEEWLVPGPYTGVGPQGYKRSDERIRDDAFVRLTRHGRLDASQINVEVTGGELTLDGMVRSRREKRMAEDIVESIPGVSDVHNHLHVTQEGEHGRDPSFEKTGMAQRVIPDENRNAQ